MKKLIFFVVVAALVMGGFKIYHSVQKGGISGDAAVAEFHEQMNLAKDVEIYEKGTAALHAAVPQDEFQKFLSQVRSDLGNFKQGDRQQVNVSNINGNTTLVVGYASVFEKGRVEEHFAFDYNSDKPLLIRYDVKKLVGSSADAP